MTADDLHAEAIAIRSLGATVLDSTDIGAYAIEYAIAGWRVHPLRGSDGKRPVLADWTNRATSDVNQVTAWWGGRYRGYNIGAPLPDPVMVLDVETTEGHGVDGVGALEHLEADNTPIGHTLTTITGSGGLHIWLRRPPGRLTATRLPGGVELRASSVMQCVLPPSVNPRTRRAYRWSDPHAPVAAPPRWLIDLLRPEKQPRPATPPRPRMRHDPLGGFFTGSIADQYSSATSWQDILAPHGWTCLDPDPDADGARWRHPTATSPWSATIQHGCLFVYSPNTPFDVTEPGNPKGYTRFRAHAILNHGGDMSKAAKSLQETQQW
ncbi:bifunctional DNA primase/polymerase [Candidatus Mycolicibacterium alkanivorans]|uniref:Bifunctional DNA primase/polymerase n=1 Tax=Candidatus Mycolicibacterium alkanivorans TaxID=2954114 RepID=A0ABS9YX04_9MYCO|nr:bifunctional DNA primase/polymerase [Candidatus Mycolicibacterium alkanivorans]MCI4675288.1 bifunctional DNA primase/polymerase [Candidatus Mycolicibacterium alkanivorans]